MTGEQVADLILELRDAARDRDPDREARAADELASTFAELAARVDMLSALTAGHALSMN